MIQIECRTHALIGSIIMGSDNGLLPARRQAIISANANILPIGAFRTNVSETKY